MPGTGYFPMSYWIEVPPNNSPQTTQAIDIAIVLGCSPELNGKKWNTLLIGHREIKQELTWKTCSLLTNVHSVGRCCAHSCEEKPACYKTCWDDMSTGETVTWRLWGNQPLGDEIWALLHSRERMPDTVNLDRNPWLRWPKALERPYYCCLAWWTWC